MRCRSTQRGRNRVTWLTARVWKSPLRGVPNVALRRALVKSDGAGAHRLLRSVPRLLVRPPYASEIAHARRRVALARTRRGTSNDSYDATTQHRPNARRAMGEWGTEGGRSDGEGAGSLQ